jgi:hypothetical protein
LPKETNIKMKSSSTKNTSEFKNGWEKKQAANEAINLKEKPKGANERLTKEPVSKRRNPSKKEKNQLIQQTFEKSKHHNDEIHQTKKKRMKSKKQFTKW